MSLGKDEGDLIYKEKWFEELGILGEMNGRSNHWAYFVGGERRA